MLGGLAALRSEQPSRRDIAYAAHRLEVDILGAESGIQDQLDTAFGGINYIEIERYPEAMVHTLPVWEELSSLLTLLFLGRSHNSSGVHRQVIEEVRRHGSGPFRGYGPRRLHRSRRRPRSGSRWIRSSNDRQHRCPEVPAT